MSWWIVFFTATSNLASNSARKTTYENQKQEQKATKYDNTLHIQILQALQTVVVIVVVVVVAVVVVIVVVVVVVVSYSSSGGSSSYSTIHTYKRSLIFDSYLIMVL